MKMFQSLVSLLIAAVVILGWVRTFEKAGRQWWEAIVPVYNIYVWIEIAGKPGWWLVLMFIPLVNIVMAIIVLSHLAKRFNKSGWFAAGLLFFPFIFYPILGLGDSVYQASEAAPAPVQ